MCGIPNQSPFESFRSVQGRVPTSIRTRVTSILVKHFSGSGNLKVQNALSLKVSDIVRKTSIFITYKILLKYKVGLSTAVLISHGMAPWIVSHSMVIFC